MRSLATSRRRHIAVSALCAAFLLAGCASATGPAPSKTTPSVQAAEAMIRQADKTMAKGDLATAATAYRRALVIAPNHPAAQLGLAEIELVSGDPQRALDLFKSVSENAQLKPAGLQGQGLSLLKLHHLEEAEGPLKEAVSLDASSWRAWNGLGSVRDAHREWELADEAYRNAHAVNAGSAIVFNNWGVSLMMRHDYVGAESKFTEALASDSGLKTAAANRRMAQAWQGRYAEALADAVPEQISERLNDVGYIAMLRGDYPNAEAFFVRAMAASPSFYAVAHKNFEQLERMKAGKAVVTTQ